ncbi:MAG: hypothetical protein JWN40_3505 [Phycisphaerales bacterium]|nr:hypothetical protein [Phycisphaerales bacterium]
MISNSLEGLESRLLLTGFTSAAAWRISSPGDETISSQAVDAAGNVYVAGTFKGTVDFNPSATKTFNVIAQNAGGDAFVARFSPTGGLYWVWRLGGAVDPSRVAVNDLAIDKATGQLLVGGSFEGVYDFGQAGTGDAFVPGLALLSTGGTDGFWARVNTRTGLPTAVGRVSGAAANAASLDDAITQIDSDAAGNLIVAGLFPHTRPTISGSTSYDDVLITKFAASGRFLWQQRINADMGDLGSVYLAVDPTGAVFTAGNAASGGYITFVGKHGSMGGFSTPAKSSYIASFDGATGKVIRLKVLGPTGGTGNAPPAINDLTLDRDGNLVIVGTLPSGIDLSLGAGTAIINNVGYSDGFVAKYSQNGVLLWWQQIGNDGETNEVGGDDAAESVAVDALGYVYVGGRSSLDLFFTGKSPRTNYGEGRFLAKYTASGRFLTAEIVRAPVTHLAPAPRAGVFAAGLRYTGIFPDQQGDVVITQLT